jgi:hypothetical protein
MIEIDLSQVFGVSAWQVTAGAYIILLLCAK